jgi:hypothetical protein
MRTGRLMQTESGPLGMPRFLAALPVSKARVFPASPLSHHPHYSQKPPIPELLTTDHGFAARGTHFGTPRSPGSTLRNPAPFPTPAGRIYRECRWRKARSISLPLNGFRSCSRTNWRDSRMCSLTSRGAGTESSGRKSRPRKGFARGSGKSSTGCLDPAPDKWLRVLDGVFSPNRCPRIDAPCTGVLSRSKRPFPVALGPRYGFGGSAGVPESTGAPRSDLSHCPPPGSRYNTQSLREFRAIWRLHRHGT